MLGWATYTLPPCWSVWLRKIILSSDYFREGHLHNQLTHSTDTAVYLKQSPLCWDKFSFLYDRCGHFLHSFLSFMNTSPLPIFSEPSSTVGVRWSVTPWFSAHLPSWSSSPLAAPWQLAQVWLSGWTGTCPHGSPTARGWPPNPAGSSNQHAEAGHSLDDILTFSTTQEAHIDYMQEVSSDLRQKHLYAKLKKCSFKKLKWAFTTAPFLDYPDGLSL